MCEILIVVTMQHALCCHVVWLECIKILEEPKTSNSIFIEVAGYSENIMVLHPRRHQTLHFQMAN